MNALRCLEAWKFLPIVGGLIVILGVKFALIGLNGNVTPYWDQWDGEAAILFKPFLTGTLPISDLFGPHNEHRILWTRLVALALLKLNGSWDPILEMAVNAVIHAAAIGIFLIMMSRALDALSMLIFILFSMLILSIPFGYENLLWGFQSQFYFVLLFGFLSLYLLCDSPAWSRRWWAGTLSAICGYFTVASGALTLPAFMAVALVQLTIGRRSGAREWTALAIHGAIAVVLLLYVPRLAEHEQYRAHSLDQFIRGIFIAGSWPVAAANWSDLSRKAGFLFLYAPFIVVFVRLLRERAAIDDKRWLFIVSAAWMTLQIVALALGRVVGLSSSRYLDTFIFATVLNFACLLYLVQRASIVPRRQIAGLVAASVWIVVVVVGVSQKGNDKVASEIADWRNLRAAEFDNLKRYLATNDASQLEIGRIPYPSAERLRSLVSDPVIRAILPAALLGATTHSQRKPALVKLGALLVPIGFAIFLAAALALGSLLRRARQPASQALNSSPHERRE